MHMERQIPVADLAADPRIEPVVKELESLYAEMDRQYDQAAAGYGFSCTGCADNCCLTRFYHHTFLEYIFLRRGFEQLSGPMRADIQKSAVQYADALRRAQSNVADAPFRMMCPLNREGWCVLYGFRPMICRLHGIPHELEPPGRQRMVFYHGCAAFDSQCGHLPYHGFDRTPFYIRMSGLEQDLKQKLGISEKSKKTVADMLIHDKVPIHAIS